MQFIVDPFGPALAVAVVVLVHPLLAWVLLARDADAPGRGAWLLAGVCTAASALLSPAGAGPSAVLPAGRLPCCCPPHRCARALALARLQQRPPPGWPLVAALLALPLAAQGGTALGGWPAWVAEVLLAACWLLAHGLALQRLGHWLRERRRRLAAVLAAASLLELLALAALRWGALAASAGLPLAPEWPAAAWPWLLLAAAALAQGGHLGLMLDHWQHLELVARERWIREAEQRELQGRDTALQRQTLAEREASRQRDALAMHRQLLLQGLDHDVHQPLQQLSARLWQLAETPAGRPAAVVGAGASVAAPPAELQALAQAADTLGEALDALLNEALLEQLPLASPPPSALALGFLVQMAVLDLTPSLRERVQVDPLPADCLLPVELNLFRLGLRHLLRHCLRQAPGDASLVLGASLSADGAWVCLSPQLQATPQGEARHPAPDDARALDIVHRIAGLHGGRLDLDARRPPRWWLPCRRG